MDGLKVKRLGGHTATLMTLALSLAIGSPALAQTVPDNGLPPTGLNIPANPTIFGNVDPNIRKPTAIVNRAVLTGTDVDQRVALLVSLQFKGAQLSAEELEQFRLQVLRQLIDETLQIQEAQSKEIRVTPQELTQGFARVARNFEKSPDEMREMLKEMGSSERSLLRQIEADLAWSRLLSRQVNPFINVGTEEVESVIRRLEQAKGTEEYNIKEIYLSATPDRADEVFKAMTQMIEQMKTGTPFEYFAGTYSEASTRAQQGDLGWIRLAMLPDALAEAAQRMQVGQLAGPIEVPGGFSLLYLVDQRQVLVADPRDARLSLRQLTLRFPAGTTEAQAATRAAEFATQTQAIQGCGDANTAADRLGAEVVDNDAVTARTLPPALQDIVLKMQVGQASPPFGSPQDGVRVLILCGRDDPRVANLPSAEAIQDTMTQERVNLRAQRMLRDLRRDAVVEYR